MAGVAIIGIDPGKGGGIAILSSDGIMLEPMPLTEENEIDVKELSRLIGDHARDVLVAYVEKVHAMPKQGVTSMFSFGKAYGIVIGVLISHGVGIIDVRPQEWMETVYLHALRCGLKGAGTETKKKQRSLLAFERLFPGVDAKRTAKSKVQHDGLVEAALIAWYGRHCNRL